MHTNLQRLVYPTQRLKSPDLFPLRSVLFFSCCYIHRIGLAVLVRYSMAFETGRKSERALSEGEGEGMFLPMPIPIPRTREYPVNNIPLLSCQTEWDKEGFFL